ncbi:DUF3089 domain-containing protein [Sphingomonas glacialis]|uniref:DUF3089 domain-containing protein n=1 Tax=Sphingomonas glacialis TaxID=658225 RepID=A0A502FZX5_9SPHN|nr:DUF3089 domain-containing protein [Sphingomonas glacialis]TPG55128.1 DUF3089 domain-containing protein [Sphingomonas glacialis]
MKSFLVALTIIAAPALATPQAGTPAPPSVYPAPVPPPPPTEPDYGQSQNWLCRPGRLDACDGEQTATIIKADGSRSIEKFGPTSSPKFDCFYVYPTVSFDRTPNSDMIAGPEENTVAAFQAGRFAEHCRVFAPLYRQVTLTALQALLVGKPVVADRAMAYRDVKAAWEEYLAYDNHGRGVVLIGHSQGSGILKQLVADAIEGTPQQKLIISVLIPGTNVAVPAGKDVGGDFKSTPLCHNAKDVGCVVSYVSFRAESPPPANSRFGVVPEPGMVAACVNPAALEGGSAVSDAYLGARGAGMASAPMGPWTTDGAAVTTPFVKVPGLISIACTTSGRFSYLAVSVNAKPTDKRTQTIVGDVAVRGRTLPEWGLHLIDLPIAMGDLVELSDAQAKVWAGKQPISAAQ